MSINAQNRSLPDWFTRVRTRQTVLPRFQRFEAWTHWTVNQMLNTVLRDLPVGALLVLEIGDKEPFISRPIQGAPETGERITEHLLDGQQRLTGLWRALHNNYEDRTYFLYLNPDEETDMAYRTDSIARWRNEKDGKDAAPRPFWANTAAALWERRMVPLDLCAPGDEAQRRYRAWAREAISDDEEREDAFDTAAKVRQKFASFNLPFLSLPVATRKETALDVFIKMNTSASPLTRYDIVVAQVEAGLGTSLHDLVRAVKADCPNLAAYYGPEELVLYASALLQGRPPTDLTYLASDFGPRMLQNWDSLVKGIGRTVAFLEEEGVFDAQRLPTDVVVPVLTALWAEAAEGLDAEGRAREILSKYLWRAFFTNRYESSTNSRALTDFHDLKALISNSGLTGPTVFDPGQYPLPAIEELIGAAWPKQKDRLARAILALALKHGGLDLADGGTVTRENLKKREYHHLFPDAHLKRLGLEDRRIYCSLNCALVTWKTNRTISDKDPERYLAERRDGSSIGEAGVRARLDSHLIPFDEMVAGDYEAFLRARASLIEAAMNDLCDAAARPRLTFPLGAQSFDGAQTCARGSSAAGAQVIDQSGQ